MRCRREEAIAKPWLDGHKPDINEEAESINYRPSNYAYTVLNQPTGGVVTEELKGVVSALCSFSRTAYEYNDSGIQPA